MTALQTNPCWCCYSLMLQTPMLVVIGPGASNILSQLPHWSAHLTFCLAWQDLWAARSRLPPTLQGTSAFRSILSALLLTNWHRGEGKDLFSFKTGAGCLGSGHITGFLCSSCWCWTQQFSILSAGLLHATPPEHLFDALLKAFHAATTPLVAGWHLGLLVGMPDDPQAAAKSSAAAGSGATKGGWPLPPARATVVYQTYNQVDTLRAHSDIAIFLQPIWCVLSHSGALSSPRLMLPMFHNYHNSGAQAGRGAQTGATGLPSHSASDRPTPGSSSATAAQAEQPTGCIRGSSSIIRCPVLQGSPLRRSSRCPQEDLGAIGLGVHPDRSPGGCGCFRRTQRGSNRHFVSFRSCCSYRGSPA